MQRTHEENLITWQGQISNDAGTNKCSAIPSNIEEDYSAMTLSRLGFVFSTHPNAFKVKLHSKKLFPWFISAKFWRVAIQVLLKISLKTSIIVSFILASETRSIFSCKSLPWAVIFAHPIWRTINYMEFCSCLFVYITNLYLSIRQKKFHETPSSSAAIFSKKNSALWGYVKWYLCSGLIGKKWYCQN